MIIAVAVFPLAFVAYKELYVKPLLLSRPEALRPFVDPPPFFSTVYWDFTKLIWIGLGIFWLGVGVTKISKLRPKTKHNKMAVAAVLSLSFITAFFQINTAKAEIWNPDNIVDVLMIGDEEFRARPDWMENAENRLQEVSDDRFADSNIIFYARGWLAWDSLDSETWEYALMQEAIVESGLPRQQVEIMPDFWGWGFISGSEWVDDNGLPWYIDLLLIFTGQDMDIWGMSIHMCNATIIRHGHVDLRTMTHELGHQFYLDHCGISTCVMNVDWQFGDNFCEECRADLTANAGKWHMNEYTPPVPSGPSSGYRWTTYWYTTSVINPDGADIKYQFDWGDGTSDWTGGTYDSGEPGSWYHRWNSIGSYLIRTRAKDDHGHYSSWSPYKKVNIIKKPGFPCPTLFVWNGSQYAKVGALDIHGDSDVTFLQGIEQTLVPEKHLYQLSLRELDEFTSHIDYVKLYAIDNDVQKHECHLVQAVHSEVGHVERLLLQDDDNRVDLNPMQTIDLKFTAPNINEIAYFIFEINGYNIKP